ncbi:Mannose-1-phosphate guanylyltransferase [Novipirellula artificiosorum]|uniref:Mannose-1-phosphate guanylyltransferase n=2 Tax=Novipirellula artificiosorum TaxID=2528016 RepID=A0A5C6DW08_9BACT|nr:Mannose-1-phosphate guanylyltransferase [Novipirellula artificiosorum]
MSRANLPKQLIPFIGGKSLLQLAFDRLEGLVPASNRYVCAGQGHAEVIADSLVGFSGEQFLGEPIGRDTLNAVAFSAAAIAAQDPDAVIAVFTADHIIEPIDEFLKIVDHGFRLAEQDADTLVTFGIAPTVAATGYGYLELGDVIDDSARVVKEFREKPDQETAGEYFAAGPQRYLWNSGMFVWKASTLLECVRRYEPEISKGIDQIGAAWTTPQRDSVLAKVFPTLKKISVDFAVMEPASRDLRVRVAAVPMPLQWLDVGSWPMFAETCENDGDGNSLGSGRSMLLDTRRTLVASSDPEHLITTIGCEDLIIIHTPDATLVCRADQAEEIKQLHQLVGEKYGPQWL